MLLIQLFILQLTLHGLIRDGIALDSAISKALKQNLQLKQYSAQLQSVQYKSLQEISPEKPQVSFYSEEMLNGPSEIQRVNRWQISQKFEFPLVYYTRAKRVSYLSESSEYELQEYKVDLAYQVRTTYWEVKLRHSLLTIAREGLEMAESFQRITEKLFEFGEVSKLQMIRSKIEVEKSKSKVSDAEKAFETSITQFQILLGDSERLTLTDSLEQSLPKLKLALLLEYAEENNPVPKKIAAKKNAAGELKSTAILSLFPSITLTYFNQKFVPAENAAQRFSGGEVSLSLPIWGWIGDRATIGEMANLEHAIEFEERYLREVQKKQITNIHKQYELNVNQLNEITNSLMPSSQEAFRLALTKYEKGEIGYLELLDTRSVVLESKEILVMKQVEVLKVYAELLRYIGKIE